LIALGAWQVGGAVTIHAKAWLAQVLLRGAWAATLAGEREVKPWLWADTWPVARLRAPGLDVDRIVLAGASGRTLAFGPGHLDGSAPPGTAGHSLLSGHRDTHFRFLKDLGPGAALRLQRPDGAWTAYRVTGAEVIDARHARLATGDGTPALTLVTCYPFDAVAPGGPLRYVVFAEGESPDEPETTEAQRHREPARRSPPRHEDHEEGFFSARAR
jgi:sortase A